MTQYPGTPIQLGDNDASVIEVQKALGLGAGGQTGVYGPYTRELVTKFQQSHGILTTGIVGPDTWNALFLESNRSQLGAVALTCALTRVGIMEDPPGSNSGPQVSFWLKQVGLSPGQSWCVAFAYSMVLEACSKLGLNIDFAMPKTGSASFLFSWAKRNGKLAASPSPGDIFLVRGGETGHYHVGFVHGNPGGNGVPDRFSTVEGNSNDDGSANGIGVFARVPGRRLDTCDFMVL